MEPCVLAIDLGASSGRVIAALTDGKTLRWHEIHRFANEPVSCCGSLYWDVLYLFSQIKKGITLASLRYDVKSLAIDSWGVDFGLLDETGRLIENPVCYRDGRTHGILDALAPQISMPELYAQTGNTPDEINTLMQLAALQNQRPEVLKRACRLLFIPDLIGYFLTGRQACEFTIASTSQCLNPDRSDIHRELLRRLGLDPQLFAPLRYPGQSLGPLKADIAAECGCGNIEVLLCGAHDTASAIYALPSEEAHPLFLSCGTWAILGQILDQPVITPASAKLGVSNEGSHGGKTRLVRNLTGLWIIQQCKAQLQRQGTALSYDEIEAMMEEAQPYRGLIDTQDPRFREFGQTIERIHAYLTATGQPLPQTDGELFWCVYQSLAVQMKLAIDELEALTGQPSDTLYMVGGGCQSATLRQKIADATGKRVVAGPVEATALGNIAVQLIHAGFIRDHAAFTELIQRSEKLMTAQPQTSMEADIARLKQLRSKQPDCETA